MREKMFRQCSLARGTGRMVGYIEERGAKLGATVEIVADNRALWTVTDVGDKAIPASQLKFHELANKHASLA